MNLFDTFVSVKNLNGQELVCPLRSDWLGKLDTLTALLLGELTFKLDRARPIVHNLFNLFGSFGTSSLFFGRRDFLLKGQIHSWLWVLSLDLDQLPFFEGWRLIVLKFEIITLALEPVVTDFQIVACLVLQVELQSEHDLVGGVFNRFLLLQSDRG